MTDGCVAPLMQMNNAIDALLVCQYLLRMGIVVHRDAHAQRGQPFRPKETYIMHHRGRRSSRCVRESERLQIPATQLQATACLGPA
jgi:hypothetical protein